jgi:hypothetical protein
MVLVHTDYYRYMTPQKKTSGRNSNRPGNRTDNWHITFPTGKRYRFY